MAAVLDDNTLRLVRIFDAPRERVFDAWADETQFIQWMCPPGVTLDQASLDVRPGGAWRVRGHHPNRDLRHVGPLSRGQAARAAGLHLGAPCER